MGLKQWSSSAQAKFWFFILDETSFIIGYTTEVILNWQGFRAGLFWWEDSDFFLFYEFIHKFVFITQSGAMDPQKPAPKSGAGVSEYFSPYSYIYAYPRVGGRCMSNPLSKFSIFLYHIINERLHMYITFHFTFSSTHKCKKRFAALNSYHGHNEKIEIKSRGRIFMHKIFRIKKAWCL